MRSEYVCPMPLRGLMPKCRVLHPYPLQADILCSYVAFLAEQEPKHRTIKAYLSRIRYCKIHRSLRKNLRLSINAQPGICVGWIETQADTVRVPITIEIMQCGLLAGKPQCHSAGSSLCGHLQLSLGWGVHGTIPRGI